MKNFENDKKIDERFVKIDGQTKTPKFQIKVLPTDTNFSSKIVPYTLRHYFIEPKD